MPILEHLALVDWRLVWAIEGKWGEEKNEKKKKTKDREAKQSDIWNIFANKCLQRKKKTEGIGWLQGNEYIGRPFVVKWPLAIAFITDLFIYLFICHTH